MLRYLNGNNKNFINTIKSILDDRRELDQKKLSIVKKIIMDVKNNNNKSLIKYEKKFSKAKKIEKKDLKFSEHEILRISKRLNKETKKAIDLAYNRIVKFHKKQKINTYKFSDNYNNTFQYKTSAINRVGVYVPGGNASYPSSVLMNCIPAKIAGVKEIYMTTPCINKKYNSALIYAAQKCNVKEIYKVGGAQAVAAFAYGTSSIKKVDKIVGPGNEFVTLAKKEVFGKVGIDMIAGPSEVTVLADNSSKAEWIAADLIAQSEHDKNSQSILITKNIKLIKEVNIFIKAQLNKLPKKKIARESIKKFGLAIYCKNNNKIIDIINEIAPEHLELCINNSAKILNKIKNAGSIFIGNYSPEAMGDYLAGPNHVLPTSGSAKFSSGLSVYDFMKRHSVIKISKSGIERFGPSVINLAEYENLEGHAYSVKVRLKKGKK